MSAQQPPPPGAPPYGTPPPYGAPPPGYPPPYPYQPPPSWFSRNKRWFIPLVILIVVGLPAGCIGSVYFAVKGGLGAFLKSEVVVGALQQANAHPGATARLGSPIRVEDTFPPFSGNIKVENDTGTADLSLPVAGPKGKGRLHLKATRSRGQWTYQSIELAPEDGGRIVILGGTRL